VSDADTEREACARIAEAYAEYQDALREREVQAGRNDWFALTCEAEASAAREIARRIRARGGT
jgi:hypothetical protein